MIMKLLLQKKIVIDVEHSFSGKFYFCFPTPPLNINLSFLHRSIQREKKIYTMKKINECLFLEATQIKQRQKKFT